jgi:hypothetical protein
VKLLRKQNPRTLGLNADTCGKVGKTFTTGFATSRGASGTAATESVAGAAAEAEGDSGSLERFVRDTFGAGA